MTQCGHTFHNSCIKNWFITSRTCATCRQPSNASSLIKVYFENSDDNKISDLHNDLLTANSKLTKELEDLKQTNRLQSDELRETTIKLKTVNEDLKTLERSKQCDDMALAGYRAIKEESEKEIVRLKEQVNTLALDLLAEKQLRRIHQTTLAKFESDNPNYDISAILNDESVSQRPTLSSDKNKHYSITPFWQLNCEAKTGAIPKETNKNKPYVIPSKIQKADTKPHSTQPTRMAPEFKFRHHYKSTMMQKEPTESSRPRSSSPVAAFNVALAPFSQFQFGTNQSSAPQSKNLFKFGDSSSSSAGASGSAFRNENSNSQNGFQLLSSSQASSALNQNFAAYSTRYREQVSSPTAEALSPSTPSSSKKFSFAQKISDR